MEKIVGALITLIVVGTCTWVCSTLADTTQSVTTLKMETKYLAAAVVELKDELSHIHQIQSEIVTSNRRDIDLINERMRQDDRREEHDTRMLYDLDDRLDAVEIEMKNLKSGLPTEAN